MNPQEDVVQSKAEGLCVPESGSEVATHKSSSPEKQAALEYARRLFEDVNKWYQNADTKAQITLTLNGVFLAFLTSSVFAEPTKLTAVLSKFTPPIWVLLGLMCVSLTGSIVSVLACLWSRLYPTQRHHSSVIPRVLACLWSNPHSRPTVEKSFENLGIKVADASTYKPEVMWFFQYVRRLDEKQFQVRLQTMDDVCEIQALAHEIHALSKNVEKKHRWVDCGFMLAGGSFVLFLMAGVIYVVSQ